MRGGDKGTINPSATPHAAACPHHVPPPLSQAKIFVTEEVLSPAWAGGVNFGAAQECWGCSPFVFLEIRAGKSHLRGAGEVWKEQFCDSLLAWTRGDLFIYCFLLHVFTERQLSSLLLRGSEE